MNNNQVDMIGEARNAQWNPKSFLGEDSLRMISPAKVNLFLDVQGKRADGYHDVATVMHSLLLSDSVFMASDRCEQMDLGQSEQDDSCAQHPDALNPGDDIAFGGPARNIAVKIDLVDKTSSYGDSGSVWGPSGPPPAKDNLAFMAIDKLARKIGRSKDETIKMRIEKSIPSNAGLGGGSSNAAAALLGAAHIWGVSNSGETLKEVAYDLGVDVAFFLHGGCCSFLGRGDRFDRSLVPAKGPLVVVKPRTGVSTALAYERFDADPKKVSAEDWVRFENAADAESVPLVNNLTEAALGINPDIAEILEWLSSREGMMPLMSGSGSAVFAKVDSFSDALKLVAEAKRRGWWARATYFSPLSAQVVETR